jgi:hypothetical protein
MGDRIAAKPDHYAAPVVGEGRDALVPSVAMRITVSVIAVYAAAALLLLPVAKLPGPFMPGVIPMFIAGMVITETATSFLLFVLFRGTRSWSILLLGCAYLYSAMMALAQLITFPGAILPEQPLLPVSPQTAAWIFVAWNTGFAWLVLGAVCLEAWFRHLSLTPQSSRRAALVAPAAVAVAVAVAFLAIVFGGDELLMISDGRFTTAAGTWRTVAVLSLAASIGVILLVIRTRSQLYLWLSLALTAMLFHNLLAGAGGGRFTVGWLVGRLSWLVSAAVLFIYFLQLFSRQQRFLQRTHGLLRHSAKLPKAELREADELLSDVEAQLATFVARENVVRYKAMLDSQPREVHRQVITNLLAEEESRLHRASAGRVH